jgi:hypothetical protein
MAKAYKAKDLKAMAKFHTPDWTSTQPGKKPITHEQAMVMMPKYFELIIAFGEVSGKIKKVTIEGGKAIVIVDHRETYTLNDKFGLYGPKGKTRKVTVMATVEDTWVRTPEGWKQKSRAKLGPYKYIVDGKPFEPDSGLTKQ